MALSAAWLDELRARVTLSTLIGGAVKITKSGREWKACCPFHGEKTASFTINDDKGFYHCFGCGAHGDAIRWMTDHGGLPFMDAVKELAAGAGLDVPAPTPEAAARAQRIDGVRPALEAAQHFYARALETAGAAREYLFARGLDDAAIARWGLGWAPSGHGHLRETGMTFEAALAAGLVWRARDDAGRERSGETFFVRVMVPVHDGRGQIVGFGGRALTSGSLVAKYKNSPDSEIFDKGRVLFNLHRARGAARTARRLIIVEGYFDVISLDCVGISEAVAPMGTALTAAQMELAWRVDGAPILAMDGDRAGRAAARRACENALPLVGPGRTLRVALFPDGQDPDDVARSGGADAVEAVLARAVGAARFLFDCIVTDCPAELERTPEDVAGIWAACAALAETISDGETRAQYLATWRGWFDRDVSGARARAADDGARRGVAVAPGERSAEAAAAVLAAADDDGEARLRMIVTSIMAERAERRKITERIRDQMAVAKALGYHPSAITRVICDLEADAVGREDFEALWSLYRRVLGVRGPMLEGVLPALTEERQARAAGVADKRLSKTLAMLAVEAVSTDAPASKPAALTDEREQG